MSTDALVTVDPFRINKFEMPDASQAFVALLGSGSCFALPPPSMESLPMEQPLPAKRAAA